MEPEGEVTTCDYCGEKDVPCRLDNRDLFICEDCDADDAEGC